MSSELCVKTNSRDCTVACKLFLKNAEEIKPHPYAHKVESHAVYLGQRYILYFVNLYLGHNDDFG